jgi:hypothetical protein
VEDGVAVGVLDQPVVDEVVPGLMYGLIAVSAFWSLGLNVHTCGLVVMPPAWCPGRSGTG